jgi:hypothetical protein
MKIAFILLEIVLFYGTLGIVILHLIVSLVTETVCMQSSWLHKEVHRPQLSEEARENCAWCRVLCQQEAQGPR